MSNFNTEYYIKEFTRDLDGCNYHEALSTFNEAEEQGVDLSEIAEADEGYQDYLKAEDHILSRCEKGGEHE